jgi:dTDP-4-dehydrorhamnose 3,5-epimerase
MINFQFPRLLKHGVSLDSRGRFLSFLPSEIFEPNSGFGGVRQINLSVTSQPGTVRGMHGQLAPFTEAKMVTCVRGRIYDVLLDVRKDSPTFLEWVSFELSAEDKQGLLVPKGYLHGFQSLDHDVEILYVHDRPYRPSSEMRINPFDDSVGISWPHTVTLVSSQDLAAPSIGPDFEGLSV